MESIYHILMKAHSGLAMLLALLAVASVVCAVLTVVAGTKDGLLKAANGVGLGETIAAGLVTLSGLVIMVFGPWPMSSGWMWIGLLLMVVYSILLKRLTKPARLDVGEDGSAIRWAGLTILHLGIVVIVFYLMKHKSF